MKIKTAAGLTLAFLLAAATPGMAKPPAGPDIFDVAIAPLFADAKLAARLPKGVTYRFADQPVEVERIIGPTHSHRVTVRGARSRPDACRWVLLGILKGMGENAVAKGGNAVVAIRSEIDDKAGDQKTFRCRIKENVVGVSMTGDIAVVK